MASNQSERVRRSGGLRAVPVSRLDVGQNVEFPLYHQTGTLILAYGQQVQKEHIVALELSGIKTVYECRSEDDLNALVASNKKRAVPLTTVQVGVPSPFNIYDSKDRFLLRKGGKLQSSQYQRMVDANVLEVFVDEEDMINEYDKFSMELTKAYANRLESGFAETDMRVETGSSLLGELLSRRPEQRAAEDLAVAENVAKAGSDQTGEILNSLRTAQDIDAKAAEQIVDALTENIQKDYDLALGLTHEKDEGLCDFLRHSYNVATLATCVGMVLGYNEKDLKDLSTAALLHEVGMLRVPEKIITKKGKLEPEEKEILERHPVFALEILKKVSGIKEQTALVVYQEHERPDRSGYPNRRPGVLVHDFAKIINVCDTYEALTSQRGWRDPLGPYKALEQMVKMTSRLQFEPAMIRALLQAIGLFPIGSWLKLSNGDFAKVIGANPARYDRPLVCTLFDENEVPLARPKKIDLSKNPDLTVAEVFGMDRFPGELTMGF